MASPLVSPVGDRRQDRSASAGDGAGAPDGRASRPVSARAAQYFWLFATAHLVVWTVYLVAQLVMIVCFWAAWRLGREMLAPGAALLAAALLECSLYYNFTTSELNNNIALYPFWALAVLFFYRAVATGAPGPWGATGACVGLGLLAKYSMGMLVLPMLAFMLVEPTARRHWSRPGPYLALLVALVLFAPHLYWASQHRFPG